MIRLFRISQLGLALAVMAVSPVLAQNLYDPDIAVGLTSDIRASHPGDSLTVIIVQTAEARNSARNSTDRRTGATAGISASGLSEFADLSLSRDFEGVGEVRRSESFATQMSATVESVYPNGDLQIAGSQHLQINGEATQIDIVGRVRPVDIRSDNTIPSTRIANARIRYDGEGFVTNSARPGLITRIFNKLGL